MPRYGWSGPGNMRELSLDRAEAPKVVNPTDVNAGTGDEKEKYFVCKVCKQAGQSKKFRKAMIMARHFNSSHEGMKEDAESWRKHVEEVWE